MKMIDTVNASRPMNDTRIPQMVTKLGHTTYEVNIHFSKTSKETMIDKVLRLIRNEVTSKG